jgi:hypothetical protein
LYVSIAVILLNVHFFLFFIIDKTEQKQGREKKGNEQKIGMAGAVLWLAPACRWCRDNELDLLAVGLPQAGVDDALGAVEIPRIVVCIVVCMEKKKSNKRQTSSGGSQTENRSSALRKKKRLLQLTVSCSVPKHSFFFRRNEDSITQYV